MDHAAVDAIPAAGHAICFLGDPEAWAAIGDLVPLARDYATGEESRAAWWKLLNALPIGELEGSAGRSEVVARLASQLVFPGHGAVTHTELRAFRRGGLIVWSNGCIGWEPSTMRIMPDFGRAYSWAEDGCHIDVDLAFPEVPGIKAMHRAFARWQRPFDLAEWQPTEPMLPGFDWPRFHARGLRLAGRLKQLLGDRVQVIYEKAWEDPGHEAEGVRLMVARTPAAAAIS